jgi:hypothetical protein
MNLEKFVVVSGLPGVYRLIANRPNGLVIEDIDTRQTKFASSRQHQFTPLATVGVYSLLEEGTVEVKTVFKTMLEKIEELPLANPNAPKAELMEYFSKILPDYDPARVFPSHVSKILKWFSFLNERNLLSQEEEATTEDTAENS